MNFKFKKDSTFDRQNNQNNKLYQNKKTTTNNQINKYQNTRQANNNMRIQTNTNFQNNLNMKNLKDKDIYSNQTIKNTPYSNTNQLLKNAYYHKHQQKLNNNHKTNNQAEYKIHKDPNLYQNIQNPKTKNHSSQQNRFNQKNKSNDKSFIASQKSLNKALNLSMQLNPHNKYPSSEDQFTKIVDFDHTSFNPSQRNNHQNINIESQSIKLSLQNMNKQNKKSNLSTNSLNKYLANKKPSKKAAPKDQFKKYFLDINNIPYQQRSTLKQIQFINMNIKYASYALIYLILSAVSIYLITPYQSECPINATCGVYIHCDYGYILNDKEEKCVIDPKFSTKAQSICINVIDDLKYQYGDIQYYQTNNSEFSISGPQYLMKTIFESLSQNYFDNQIELAKIKYEIQNFLFSWKNQQDYQFTLINEVIQVKQKKYRISILIKKYIFSKQFLIELSGFLLIFGCGFYFVYQKKMKEKSSKIYYQLKIKIITQKILNISHQMKQLQQKFGKINEELWQRVDAIRSKDNRICYYSDQFLYWKLLQ